MISAVPHPRTAHSPGGMMFETQHARFGAPGRVHQRDRSARPPCGGSPRSHRLRGADRQRVEAGDHRGLPRCRPRAREGNDRASACSRRHRGHHGADALRVGRRRSRHLVRRGRGRSRVRLVVGLAGRCDRARRRRAPRGGRNPRARRPPHRRARAGRDETLGTWAMAGVENVPSLDELSARGADVSEAELESRRIRAATTIRRPSSTPRERPASPRAPCSRTRTSSVKCSTSPPRTAKW